MHDRDIGRVLEDLVGQVESTLKVAGLEGVARGRKHLLGAGFRRGIGSIRRDVDRL